MEALLPMFSQPVEIAGRNRMWRRIAADAIRNNPAYNNGEYQQPPAGLVFATRLFAIAVNASDDFINPTDLGIMPTMIKQVRNGRCVELPSTGMGHGTVNNPSLWSPYLVELLAPKSN